MLGAPERAYITAVTDLYREQKAIGMNSHPTPREDSVREYLKSLQWRDTQREKEQFGDKGRDTTEDEFEQVCYELWAQSDSSHLGGYPFGPLYAHPWPG